jgi:RNA polymerase sigma-70 factor (ECF subfamily)
MIMYQQSSPDLAYKAFEELYFRYNSKIFSFLQKHTHNQADSEDILQKTFIKIHESKHLYKEKFKFEQWIFIIAKSIMLDQWRSNKRYQVRLNKLETFDVGDKTENTSLSIDTEQRELLELKYIDELSYKEISQILNRSEISLRKMVSRLTTHLKRGEV